MSDLTILDQTIHIVDGLYSLTDLHKASGGARKNRPVHFFENQQTLDLVAEIEKAGIPTFKKTIGRNGGTYACKQIVLAYGMWVSPKLNLAVINAFLDRQERTQQLELPPPLQTLTPAQQRHIRAAHAGRTETVVASAGEAETDTQWGAAMNGSLTNAMKRVYGNPAAAQSVAGFSDSNQLQVHQRPRSPVGAFFVSGACGNTFIMVVRTGRPSGLPGSCSSGSLTLCASPPDFSESRGDVFPTLLQETCHV